MGWHSRIAYLATLTMASCAVAGDTSGAGLDLRDPLNLLEDVQGPLEVLIFQTETRVCDPDTGLLTPRAPEAGTVADAIVDISFELTGAATVEVRPGSYSILVRGRGTDVVSGRSDVTIASGCAQERIEAGQTREVQIELQAVFGEGICGDGILSPDEHCEDGNSAEGDGCSAGCRSEPFLVSRAPSGQTRIETLPSVAWAEGTRAAVVYDVDAPAGRDPHLMVLSEDGGIVDRPSALAIDAPVETLGGVQTNPAVAVSPTRTVVAFADFAAATAGGDVRARFFDQGRNALGPGVRVTVDSTGAQAEPAVAMLADGTALIVFEDDESTTGLHGRLFDAGSTTPRADGPFVVGSGVEEGAAPTVSGSTEGFVVAFEARGEVFYQRFDAGGAPRDATAMAVAQPEGGSARAPAVASLADGRSLLFFLREEPGGSSAESLWGLALDAADGSAQSPFEVSPTVEGDLGEPAVAAAGEHFLVVFAVGDEGRGQLLTPEGTDALNREQPPSPGDFRVAPSAHRMLAVAAGGPEDDPKWLVVFQDGDGSRTSDVRGRLFATP